MSFKELATAYAVASDRQHVRPRDQPPRRHAGSHAADPARRRAATRGPVRSAEPGYALPAVFQRHAAAAAGLGALPRQRRLHATLRPRDGAPSRSGAHRGGPLRALGRRSRRRRARGGGAGRLAGQGTRRRADGRAAARGRVPRHHARFRAYVLGDNRRMLDLLRRYTDVVEQRTERGVVDLLLTEKARAAAPGGLGGPSG